MDFLNIKALHIIFVITWFAGLFYIVRLFIYHAEAEKKEESVRLILQEQYKLMEKRLWYIITLPSSVLASIFGFWLIIQNPVYLEMPWMHVKLTFILVLYFYQWACHIIFKQLQKDEIKYSSFKLRLLNEIPTIILFAVVFLVVLKNAINWIWGVVGIILFSILIMLGIRMYKRIRQKRSWDKEENRILKENKKNETTREM